MAKPARFFGAVAETKGRISDDFHELLTILATHYCESADGFHELPPLARRAAIAAQLDYYYYMHVSASLQRAVVGGLARAAARVRAKELAPYAGHRRRRTQFRGRPPPQSTLLAKILPQRLPFRLGLGAGGRLLRGGGRSSRSLQQASPGGSGASRLDEREPRARSTAPSPGWAERR